MCKRKKCMKILSCNSEKREGKEKNERRAGNNKKMRERKKKCGKGNIAEKKR